jgi:tetratricopeptide (TPR) repeat protein
VFAAVDLLNEAVRLDPVFALAWAKLAEVNARLYFKQFDTTPARKEAARIAAETATKLKPDAPATVLANGFYRYHVLHDYDGARVLFEKVRREVPSNSDALLALALVARRQSRWSEALQLFEQATQLNPRDADLLTEWMAGDKSGAKASYAQARDELEKFVREQPNNVWIVAGLANAYAGLGNQEAALREGERSIAVLSATEDPVTAPVIEEFLALTEAQVGEADRAIARLERLLTVPYGPDPITLALLRLDPAWDPLRSHPRFQKLLTQPEPKTRFD